MTQNTFGQHTISLKKSYQLAHTNWVHKDSLGGMIQLSFQQDSLTLFYTNFLDEFTGNICHYTQKNLKNGMRIDIGNCSERKKNITYLYGYSSNLKQQLYIYFCDQFISLSEAKSQKEWIIFEKEEK